MKKRTHLKAKPIFEIWQKRKYQDLSYVDIAGQMDLPYHLVVGADRRLDKYINHPDSIEKKNKQFVSAANEARTYLLTMNTPKKELFPERETQDRIVEEHAPAKRLADAMENLQNAIVDFLDQQIKPIQDENRELRNIISESKHQNWFSALANKFGNK